MFLSNSRTYYIECKFISLYKIGIGLILIEGQKGHLTSCGQFDRSTFPSELSAHGRTHLVGSRFS